MIEVSRVLSEPTDPDDCECGHDGLAIAFHLQFCPLSARYGPTVRHEARPAHPDTMIGRQ